MKSKRKKLLEPIQIVIFHKGVLIFRHTPQHANRLCLSTFIYPWLAIKMHNHAARSLMAKIGLLITCGINTATAPRVVIHINRSVTHLSLCCFWWRCFLRMIAEEKWVWFYCDPIIVHSEVKVLANLLHDSLVLKLINLTRPLLQYFPLIVLTFPLLCNSYTLLCQHST